MTATPTDGVMQADDVEKIARGLTKAQRRCVLALSREPQMAHRETFNANAAFNLVSRGVTELGFDKGWMRDTYRLSPLGAAVRSYLKDHEHG